MVWNFMVTEYLRRRVRVEADSYEVAYNKVVNALNDEVVTFDEGVDLAERDVETIAEYENSRGNARGDDTHNPDYEVDDDLTEEEEEEEEDK